MSEVTPGVEEGTPAPEEQAAAPGAESAGVEEGPIPYDRFKQVNDKLGQAEQDKQKLADWARQAQPHIQRLEGENQQLKAQLETNPTPVNGQASNGQAPDEDPTERLLNDAFGRDENGQNARQIFEMGVDQALAKKGVATQQDVSTAVQQGNQQVQDRFTSASTVPNQLQNMIRSGQIDQEGATKIYQKVQQQFASDPDLANRPNDVQHFIGSTYAQMQTSGELPIQQFQAPTNPLQPSGSSQGPPQEDKPTVDGGALKNMFQRLRGADSAQLDAKLKAQEQREVPRG